MRWWAYTCNSDASCSCSHAARACSVLTPSLQSASTRPLLSSSWRRARLPFLAAQNTALARGVSFWRVNTHNNFWPQATITAITHWRPAEGRVIRCHFKKYGLLYGEASRYACHLSQVFHWRKRGCEYSLFKSADKLIKKKKRCSFTTVSLN